jgi:hypothetical protein
MPLALAITQPRLECCTIRTVVPTGGKLTWPLLGWASAESVSLGTAVGELVSLPPDDACADDEEAGAEADDDEPALADDTAVLWLAVLEGAPPAVEVVLEFDDPPHAVSSSTSELSPVATVHPLLRITFSLLTGGTRMPRVPLRSCLELSRWT